MSQIPPKELADRVAVVTGSSRGIGRAIALELASAGAAVLVHARAARLAAEGVVEEIRSAGGLAEVVLADLADPTEQQRLVDRAWQWRGGPRIWINNAGVDILTGRPASQSFDENLQSLLQVDVTATIRLSRLAGERMKEAGEGAILNIGWDGAERGMAGDSGQLFAAAKGAVMSFSRSLAQSLAPEVRVNCLAPGWIRTAWGEQASQYWQDRARSESLMDRWGEPDDIARVARFLVSPAAQFVNAQTIDVNGGFGGAMSNEP